jgi:hypothetical protein
MKEVKRQELKMFLEFAPQYFDYLCKSFFHEYPCTLAKIVGVYKIKIDKYTEKVHSSQLITAPSGDQQAWQEEGAGIIDPDDEAEYIQSCQNQLVEGKHRKGQNCETIKKYIFVSENLNYGLTEADEQNLIRYDLKGSTLNRFVQDKEKEGKEKEDQRTAVGAAGADRAVRESMVQ